MAVTEAFLDAGAFGALASSLAYDATGVLNSAYGLAGNYGRDAAVTPNPAITSETQAIAAAALARSQVGGALTALANAVQNGGDVPLTAQGVLNATLATMSNPADQMRAAVMLATTPGGTQVAILCRRLSVIALASVASQYAPTSYNDAQAVLSQVSAALDVEITKAGDLGDDASFRALLTLRVAIGADLTARGASLAPLETVTFASNLPALVVAQRLYADAAREDELVRRIDPVHPAFMPTAMQVLAS